MNVKAILFALAGALALSLPTASAWAGRIDVVASFTVLADVVRNVGGDHVHVKSLVPANGDPHDFQPSPRDSRALKAAAVTFLSGEGLETWFERLADASGAVRKPVTVSTGIKTHAFNEDGKMVTDPHVWNSVPNVIVWVANIEKALAAADPADAAAFKTNAARYTKALRALDADIHARIAATPVARRKVLTSHDAFGYYGREYGVTFLAPLGLSTETEASAAHVAQLIDQIKAEHVKTYFFENSNDARLIRQIATATGAKPGGELYPEALSGPGGPAPTYVEMMRHNTKLIVAAMAAGA